MSLDHTHRTWIEISAEALASNIRQLQSLLDPDVTFCAVVKANAYGHGLTEIVPLCASEGVTTFAVDSLDEAHEIRRLVPAAEIIILGFTLTERYAELVDGEYIQTLYDEEALQRLIEIAQIKQVKARINLKIETGLYRQGLPERQALNLVDHALRHPEAIELAGISSHFASAEEPGHPKTQEQMTVFEAVVERLTVRGIAIPKIHMACSAAAIIDRRSHYSLVRLGLALYGLWPSAELKRAVTVSRQPLELKPVLSWRTRIAQVKEVMPGEAIGYGGTFVINRPMRVAVLPVGYYDGYARQGSGQAQVLVHGRPCPVLGIICMNMCVVDVSSVPQVRMGDIVTLLGRDSMHTLSAEDLANALGTINYEVVTRLNSKLPRLVQ